MYTEGTNPHFQVDQELTFLAVPDAILLGCPDFSAASLLSAMRRLSGMGLAFRLPLL